ncbi:MAG: DUF3341 domain-containing protein [Thermodesulfobacteriota bacterium]
MNQGVLGIYSYVDSVIDTVHKLKKAGYADLKVFSPAPNHEIEHAIDLPESPIRFFTLIGGLFGATCGFAFTILTSLAYPIAVSAKPIVSIPPYMVIVFELTILFGALSTFLGLIINSLLRNRAPITLYDERFTDDKFGIMVICPRDNIAKVEDILNSTGAEEIKFDRA